METKVFDTNCRKCKSPNGDHLMDCFCIFCESCFSELGKTVLGFSNNPIFSIVKHCDCCGKGTEFDSDDLSSLAKEEKLSTIAKRYVASMYVDLRDAVFAENSEEAAKRILDTEMLEKELLLEKKRVNFSLQILGSIIRRFGVKIEDLEPKLYFEDKFGLLVQLFDKKQSTNTENVEKANEIVDCEKTPVAHTTKRKEGNHCLYLNKQESKNPFDLNASAQKVTSFSIFKEMCDELKAQETEKSSDLKCLVQQASAIRKRIISRKLEVQKKQQENEPEQPQAFKEDYLSKETKRLESNPFLQQPRNSGNKNLRIFSEKCELKAFGPSKLKQPAFFRNDNIAKNLNLKDFVTEKIENEMKEEKGKKSASPLGSNNKENLNKSDRKWKNQGFFGRNISQILNADKFEE